MWTEYMRWNSRKKKTNSCVHWMLLKNRLYFTGNTAQKTNISGPEFTLHARVHPWILLNIPRQECVVHGLMLWLHIFESTTQGIFAIAQCRQQNETKEGTAKLAAKNWPEKISWPQIGFPHFVSFSLKLRWSQLESKLLLEIKRHTIWFEV